MQFSDPFVPVERHVQHGLARLPTWLSRWLGYRSDKVSPSPTWMVCVWGFIGAFCGLGVVFAVMDFTEYFTSRAVPPIVASFGASAILIYGAIDVPLAQPRSLIFGHFFSALIGVIVSTIFDLNLNDKGDPPKLQWLAAVLSTGIALVVMHLTKTTHPPAGATALMPCVDLGIWALRWYFLPVVLLSSTLVLAVALITNNIQRQYPKFWFAALPPAGAPPSNPQHKHRTPEPVTSQAQIGQIRTERKNELHDLEAGR